MCTGTYAAVAAGRGWKLAIHSGALSARRSSFTRAQLLPTHPAITWAGAVPTAGLDLAIEPSGRADWVTAAAPVTAQQPRMCGVKDCEVTENWFAFPIMLVVVKCTYALRATQPMRGSPFPPACADVPSSLAGPSCVCVGRTKDCFVAHIPLQWQEFTDTFCEVLLQSGECVGVLVYGAHCTVPFA